MTSAEPWIVDTRCPHGHAVGVPLSLIRGYLPLVDPCPLGIKERHDAALASVKSTPQRPAGKFSVWRETRKFRRRLKRARLDRIFRGKGE